VVVVDPVAGVEVVDVDVDEVVVVDPVAGVDVVVVTGWVVEVVAEEVVVVVVVVTGLQVAGSTPPILRSENGPELGGTQYWTTPEVPAAVSSTKYVPH